MSSVFSEVPDAKGVAHSPTPHFIEESLQKWCVGAFSLAIPNHFGARGSALAASTRVKWRSQTPPPALNPVTLPAWSRWKRSDVAPRPPS